VHTETAHHSLLPSYEIAYRNERSRSDIFRLIRFDSMNLLIYIIMYCLPGGKGPFVSFFLSFFIYFNASNGLHRRCRRTDRSTYREDTRRDRRFCRIFRSALSSPLSLSGHCFLRVKTPAYERIAARTEGTCVVPIARANIAEITVASSGQAVRALVARFAAVALVGEAFLFLATDDRGAYARRTGTIVVRLAPARSGF